MTPNASAPVDVGDIFVIHFAEFTPRITIEAGHRLTLEIMSGDNAGFRDTVEYEAVRIRDGLVMLSWHEHIGTTVVQVLDFHSGEARAAVTPAQGGFMRLHGRIETAADR